MTILCLERVVVGSSVIAEQIELAAEIGTRRNINVLSHQLASCGANVRQCKDVGIRDAALDRGVPLIGSRQHVVWIDHSHDCCGWVRGEEWRIGRTSDERKRSSEYQFLLNVWKSDHCIRD